MAGDGRGTQKADGNPLRYVHLRTHSAYSLLEGALPLKAIIAHAVADHQPAIGVADTNNLFGAMEFSVKAAEAGVQPLIGCQLSIDMGDADEEAESRQRGLAVLPSLVLIAASETGYAHLVNLVSRAYLDHDDQQPVHIRRDWLEGHCEGIIALTAAGSGPIDRALSEGHEALARERLACLAGLFGDRLYVELQRHGDYDRALEAQLVGLAYAAELPLVATNEPFFPGPEDYDAHDALLAVAGNTVVAADDRRRLTPDHHLKTAAQMAALFADLPEALDNTVEIARRCSFLLQEKDPILPRFTAGTGDGSSADEGEGPELRRQTEEGLRLRLKNGDMAPGCTIEDYQARLTTELDIIEGMGFAGYFLIVADFIQWAKHQGIPVGPGRGSGAGSLVAYALTITDVDPLQFSLLFERFLNPHRVSLPDFDIDFCQTRRDEVIRYVQDKYGRDQVAQIITFGSLQARAALRDVGRVLQMPYGQVDRICKLVPQNPAHPVSLSTAVETEERLREEMKGEEIVERLVTIALKLEGLYRHASTHAAGIVIGDRPLSQLVPMYRDPRSDMPVTQFNMKWVEKAGLVKFDFLGLKTLTVLQKAADLLAERQVEIDLAKLPLDDEKTYAMLSRGETVGVFQVESAGMRKALIGMRPDRIEDIIALVALYRPGPMDNIPTYNARKHGEEEIASIHPKVDALLAETQGVIVYQEQVMQIAQTLAGYSLSEADLLRRAMGKKIRSEMNVQRARFVEGAMARDIEKAKADLIFDLLAKFADYGFNKSHAAAYGLISYQTAYLKAHYPVEFLAASMTLDMSNTDKLKDFRQDAIRLGIEIVPPSVQTSGKDFRAAPGRIYYALAAIKGVGEAAVEHIVETRGDAPFRDIEDFCLRVDPKILNRRALESLICAGALDGFGRERAELFNALERLIGFSQRAHDDRASGQSDMFGASAAGADGDAGQGERLAWPIYQPWLPAETLLREFQALGSYLSAHPLDEYADVLARLRVQDHADFVQAVGKGATAGRLAGTVTALQIRRTRTGGRMGILQLSDGSGEYEAVLFSEALNHYQDEMKTGHSLVVTVNAEQRPDGVSLRVQTLSSLEEEAERSQKAMRIYLRDGKPIAQLQSHLTARGDGAVSLVVIRNAGESEVEIALPDGYRIGPQIASAIKAASGVVDVELV